MSSGSRRRGVRVVLVLAICGLVGAGGTVDAADGTGPTPALTARATTLAVDPAFLAAQPEAVARALRAGVVITRDATAVRASFASGVIVGLRDGVATIVTARHVVDPRYPGAPSDLPSVPGLTVTSIGGVRVRARVAWLAPHGVDLAIVSARLADREARTAIWERDARVRRGDAVFTIGNTQGGRWLRADGAVEQLRDARQDGFDFAMVLSSVAVQSGYSGGGLYDARGRLVAVNSTRGLGAGATQMGGPAGGGTQTREPALLSTALDALLDLAPAELQLRAKP